MGDDENDPINKALQPLLLEINALKKQLGALTDAQSETKIAKEFAVKKTRAAPMKAKKS